MKTVLNVAKNFSVEISIIENMVFITTDYFNNRRTYSYDSVSDAVNKTAIHAVANYLRSVCQ